MSLEVYPATPKPAYSLILDSQFRTLVSDFESGLEQRRIVWRFPKRVVSLGYKFQDFSSTGRDAIYEFFHNRRGMGETFWYFDFGSGKTSKKRKIIDEFVGYGSSQTSGELIVGKSYRILDWITNDDFVNVGGANVDGTEFVATGTTPTHWAHSSVVDRDIFDLPSKTTDNDSTLKIYVAGVLQTKETPNQYDFLSGGGQGGSDRIQFKAGYIPTTGQLITADFKGYLRIKGRFKDDKFSEELFFIDRENFSVIIYEVR